MNKKRDKKTEIDKAQLVVKQVIERSLIESNQIKSIDYLRGNFQLVLSDE